MILWFHESNFKNSRNEKQHYKADVFIETLYVAFTILIGKLGVLSGAVSMNYLFEALLLCLCATAALALNQGFDEAASDREMHNDESSLKRCVNIMSFNDIRRLLQFERHFNFPVNHNINVLRIR